MQIESARKPLVPAGIQVLLRDLVHERTGIYFDADRLDVFLDKLEPLAIERNCFSMLDFYYLLKFEEHGIEDWARVMDALSVQETYFWREMGQIRFLVDSVIPDWFKRNSNPLRIWTAASASGEEPYSIQIALTEAGWDKHPIQIVATDGSPAAIIKAREALYREKSFRCFPPELKEKYFIPAVGGSQLRPEIAKRVNFHRANLLATDQISDFARSPVIFCRNVFIYFSPHAIRQTLAAFASRMPSSGLLFVGASESLLKLTADFELVDTGQAFVYKRI